jgi:hypothetical protein
MSPVPKSVSYSFTEIFESKPVYAELDDRCLQSEYSD